MQTRIQQLRSIFDLAQNYEALTSCNAACLKRIFQVTANTATCRAGPQLESKYSVQQNNQQLVVSITNRYTLEQTWFNKSRTQKPQTFSQGAEFLDPTDNGTKCDFCNWSALTAEDPGFGRIELPYAVTGSNLFKYAAPSHGIVLFRHHQPLEFSQEQLSDLLDASWLWFQASHKLNPAATEPFLIWNCLPRAGASQYHGHAQVMLTEVPVPHSTRLKQAAAVYQQQHSSSYYIDLLRAHEAAGLLRQLTINARDTLAASSNAQQTAISSDIGNGGGSASKADHAAWGFASLCPYKDMELTVVGSHIACPAFQRMLHAALRAMIDGCGSKTFNVGILNVDLTVQPPAGVGLDRQFYSTSSNKVESSHDGSLSSSSMSISSMSSSKSETDSSVTTGGYQYHGGSSTGSTVAVPEAFPWGDRSPVIARLVSRGKLSSVASDFGGLEVFGRASIGHTDPWTVVRALDEQFE